MSNTLTVSFEDWRMLGDWVLDIPYAIDPFLISFTDSKTITVGYLTRDDTDSDGYREWYWDPDYNDYNFTDADTFFTGMVNMYTMVRYQRQ